jgi:hypothetical protein
LVRENQKTCPPSLLEFIIHNLNLNHVSVFPYYSSFLRLSCLPLACHCLAYPSRHPTAARVLAYQHFMLLSVFKFYYLGILRLAILLFRTFHHMARLWNYGLRRSYLHGFNFLLCFYFSIFYSKYNVCYIIETK